MTRYECAPQTIAATTFLVFALSACGRSAKEPAPFQAEPAPATWVRPATEVAPEATPAAEESTPRRLFGDGSWPCHRDEPSTCDEGSPADLALGSTMGSLEYLDPTLVSETEGLTVAMNLFEGLVSPARGSGLPLEQGVASRYEVSDDGRTYTFHLRKDALWSNNRPVTADDFIYAWTRKLDPANASQGAESLFWIAGGEAFNRGENRDPKSLGLASPDPHTLVVTLRCAYPFFLGELSGGHWLPVPRDAIEAHGVAWTKPENIVTNGPYHMTEWKERDRITLVRSETYWDRDEVRIPKAIFYQAESEEKPRNLFRGGQVHWARGAVSPPEIAAYMKANAPEFLLEPRLCVYFYGFRVDKPPFDDVRVRRAINMAIDKERLVTHVSRGFQVPAEGPVPPAFTTTLGYRKLEGLGFDPEGARALLAEAGYPRGQGLPATKLSYNTMEAHKLIGEFVQRSVQENLGVGLELENLEWKSLLQKLNAGDFQLARYGWCASGTPTSFLKLFMSDSPRNITGWKNERFDALVRDSECASSDKAALAAAAEAEDLLVSEAAIAPIYHYTLPYLKKPVLQGLLPHLDDEHPVKYMYWGDVQTAPTPRPLPTP